MLGQRTVQHHEIGVEEIQGAQVFIEDLGEERAGFRLHPLLEIVVELRVEFRIDRDPIHLPPDQAIAR